MDYENLNDLNKTIFNGDFSVTESITVDNKEYAYRDANPTFIELLETNKKGMVVYEGTDDRIILLYELDDENRIVPLGAHSLNEAAKKGAKKKSTSSSTASKGPDIAGVKTNMKNTMDKHKLHLDKHIAKHGDVLKDLKQQLKDATGAHKGDLEKTLAKVEDMINSHRDEMGKMSQEHSDRLSDIDKKHQDLLKAHNDAIDRLGTDHLDKLDDLKDAHEDIKRLHDERISQMQDDHEKHKKQMQNGHEEHIQKMMSDHDNKLYKMKRDHSDRMFDAKRSHGDQVRNMQYNHEENQEQMTMKHQGEMDKMQQKHDESKIGTEAHVEVLNLHSSPPLAAKVDTGATICSLHADQMKLDQGRGLVKFTNKKLSPHVISVPVASMSSVKSADGGLTYRPVIKLNLRIKDKEIADVEVNLNDREHMTHPFLIGHNALEKGKFIIDPSYIGEDIDFDYLQELFMEGDNEQDAFTLYPKEK